MDVNSYRCKHRLDTRELLSLEHVSYGEICELLVTAKELKTKAKFGERFTELEGKSVLLMTKNAFGKARVAFEMAVHLFGAHPISLPLGGSEIEELMASPESIKIIGRLGIALAVVDTSDAGDAITLSHNLSLPVVNANERSGACHALAVLLTLWEQKGRLDGLKTVIVGEPDGSRASLIYGLAKCGADVTVVAPKLGSAVSDAIDYSKQFSDVSYSSDLRKSLNKCDVVYCFSHDFGKDYIVTKEMLDATAPNALYFQNVPLVRGREADDALIDSPRSMIYEQGENLMHIERAAIYLLAK